MKTTDWTDADVATLSIRGLPFLSFVDIHESVSAGTPLVVELAERAIDLDDWVDADADLASLLTDSVGADGTLVDAFDRAFVRARAARDARAEDALFTDLEAFARTLHVVRSDRDPPKKCAELGVDPSRLARAFAHWSIAVEADAALRQRLADLLVALATSNAAAPARPRRRPALTKVAGAVTAASTETRGANTTSRDGKSAKTKKRAAR